MPHESHVLLIGQGHWVKKLAEGLGEAGFPVGTAPLDSARMALNPKTWASIWSATVLVRVGFRPGAQTWRGRAFDSALWIFGRSAKIACYWIGTDVMKFTSDVGFDARVASWRAPALSVDHHLAGSEPLQRELAAAGVSSTVVAFPWRTVEAPDQVPAFPDQFTIVSYVPDGRADFYGGPILMRLAEKFPKVRFNIMGGTGTWVTSPPANVRFLGWVDDPAAVYALSSCVIRLTAHDSIGGTAIEGLLFGRPVLYTHSLDHTIRVEKTTESVEAALETLLAATDSENLVPNPGAAAWARANYDHIVRFDALADHLRSLASRPRQQRLTYLTHQSTREGQAAHAHVHEIVKGLAAEGWSARLIKPSYASTSPPVLIRLLQFARIQFCAVTALRRSDVLYIRSHFAALPAASAARALGTPVVQEVNGPHNDAILAWPRLSAFRSLLEGVNRAQLRMADAVITVTPQLVKWIQRDAGIERVHLVPNGANTDLFTPSAPGSSRLPKNYVVFFGALAPWQGIRVALEAVKSCQWPLEVTLVVVGEGQLRGEVENASSCERVLYLGWQPYAQLPAIVGGALASLVPMPAVAQGRGTDRDHLESGLSPLKLYESMACGVPVVASDLPGLADTVRSEQCGLVVPPNNPDEIAEAVRLLFESPHIAHAMGVRGRRVAVQLHSWRDRAHDTAAVLQSVMTTRELPATGSEPAPEAVAQNLKLSG